VRRSAPRPLRAALATVSLNAAPASTLARVQQHWAAAVGEAIAREADPVAERDGTVTVACRSAVWAEELQLLAPELVRRLNDALERFDCGRPVRRLKVTAAVRPDVA
jgi:predicted nucleic acid-binding Zn ribbon protein